MKGGESCLLMLTIGSGGTRNHMNNPQLLTYSTGSAHSERVVMKTF